jgi:hypothetical protein
MAQGFLQYVAQCEVQSHVMSPDEMFWFTVVEPTLEESDTAASLVDQSHLIEESRSLIVAWNKQFRRLANAKYEQKMQLDRNPEVVPPGREPREFDVLALFSKLYVPIMAGVDAKDGF